MKVRGIVWQRDEHFFLVDRKVEVDTHVRSSWSAGPATRPAPRSSTFFFLLLLVVVVVAAIAVVAAVLRRGSVGMVAGAGAAAVGVLLISVTVASAACFCFVCCVRF